MRVATHLGWLAVALGCSSPAVTTPAADTGPGAVDGAPVDGGARDDAGDDWGFDASFVFRDSGEEASPYAHVLYLNTSGGNYYDLESGETRPTRAFIATDRGQLPGLGVSAGWRDRRSARLETLANNVRAIFDGLRVEVVTRRPMLDGYIEVVIGGDDTDTGRDLACSDRIGFASLLCGALTGESRRVAYVLPGCIYLDETYARRLAAVVAHEIGHSVGLEHIDAPGFIMNARGSSGAMGWGRGRVVPWEPGGSEILGRGDCGRVSQDSFMSLRIAFGVARAYELAPLQPERVGPALDLGLIAPGVTIRPDESLCAQVALSARGTHLEVFGAPPGGDRYLPFTHVVATEPSARFDGALTGVPAGRAVLRFTVADRAGNLTEERVPVTIDPAAPPLGSCP